MRCSKRGLRKLTINADTDSHDILSPCFSVDSSISSQAFEHALCDGGDVINR